MRIVLLLMVVMQTSIAQTIPGEYPQTSQRLLSISDIDSMSERSLRLMRNEIFARYGYIFKSAELTTHFSKTSWYKPSTTDVTAKLTQIEKSNVDLLRNQESRIKTSSEFEAFFSAFRDALVKNDVEKAMRLVHVDRMGGEEGARKALKRYWEQLRNSVDIADRLTEMENEATLSYDIRNDGATEDFIVFNKIGVCWYITGFGGIG